MRAAAAAALALALAAAPAGCGGRDQGDRTARACAGATTGEAALHGPGDDIAARVHAAEQTAADAARALPRGDPHDPSDVDAAAVRALLAQSLRLRLVRSQIARGAPPPQQVLDAAAAGAGAATARQTRAEIPVGIAG